MYVITGKSKATHITVKLVKVSGCGDAEIEITDGLEYLYSKLPIFFDIGSVGIVQGDIWEEEFTLVIGRAEDGHSASWCIDCVCVKVFLEEHERHWFD